MGGINDCEICGEWGERMFLFGQVVARLCVPHWRALDDYARQHPFWREVLAVEIELEGYQMLAGNAGTPPEIVAEVVNKFALKKKWANEDLMPRACAVATQWLEEQQARHGKIVYQT